MVRDKMLNFVFILILHIVFCNGTYWHVSSNIEDESPISDLNFDNEDKLRFTSMGKTFDLNLKPANDIFAPNFKVLSSRTLDNGQTVVEESLEDNAPLTGSFHTIDNTFGSLYIDRSDDQLRLDGIVDDNTRIFTSKPDSYKLIKLGWQNVNENPFSGDNVLINSSKADNEIISENQDSTDQVNVEVLILLDKGTIEALNVHHQSIHKYIGIFWNSVQKRYDDINHPRIKFALTGVFSLDIKGDHGSTSKGTKIDGYKVLDDLSHTLYTYKDKLPKFDLAIFQTHMDLCSPSGDQCSSNLLGRAYVGAVCHVNDYEKRMYNSGIGEDIVPLFSGVITVAHEVAHILGAPHDGDGNAGSCPHSDGYIMGRFYEGSNLWHFSSCSKQIMRNHVLHNAQCVKDNPQTQIQHQNLLPGQLVTLQQVCHQWYGNEYSVYRYENDDTCNVLRCLNANTRLIYTFGAPPEGISCGHNKICVNGICTYNKK